MDKDKHNRKTLRLKGYDYSQNGAYFITICTKDRKPLFGAVGADSISAQIIKETFESTIGQYPCVESPVYVVMPNHFHAIITIDRADMESAPTLSAIVQSFKRHSTIAYIKAVKAGLLPPFDGHIWQRTFYDHIIRNEADYLEIANYIQENSLRWQLDRFYCETE